MCDYSLHHVASRPAKIEDKLVTTKFSNSVTRGFAAVGEPDVAVCVLPGTELRLTRMSCVSGHWASCQPKKSDVGSPASGRSIWTTLQPITMPWNSRTGNWCCSRVCPKASMQPYCNCRPPHAPRRLRDLRSATLRFRLEQSN